MVSPDNSEPTDLIDVIRKNNALREGLYSDQDRSDLSLYKADRESAAKAYRDTQASVGTAGRLGEKTLREIKTGSAEVLGGIGLVVGGAGRMVMASAGLVYESGKVAARETGSLVAKVKRPFLGSLRKQS